PLQLRGSHRLAQDRTFLLSFGRVSGTSVHPGFSCQSKLRSAQSGFSARMSSARVEQAFKGLLHPGTLSCMSEPKKPKGRSTLRAPDWSGRRFKSQSRRRIGRGRELTLVKLRIDAGLGQQFAVGAALHNRAILKADQILVVQNGTVVQR